MNSLEYKDGQLRPTDETFATVGSVGDKKVCMCAFNNESATNGSVPANADTHQLQTKIVNDALNPNKAYDANVIFKSFQDAPEPEQETKQSSYDLISQMAG